ncbi:HNH endonuclease [uncultured Roseivirga sp.]|uniref:HNH endonuclease n=1 Tax=uncultured Roseivirga sp. TaxID=543088 RepID=UPI000D79423D|nr:HNH endonuclease [uncultured Roseivirga sp.]PWL32102.1 MAG: hypothetical protein DCO95_02660 [Roseivirga sp. XM-24bin3]
MKTCIWCRQTEKETSFLTKAHTFPQSLGGNNICENVCDRCNSFFGNRQSDAPSSEIVLKELLNISKFYLLNQTNSVPKNQRFKSEYFNINWDEYRIRMKPRYSIKKGFQLKLGRQFRKGVFKVFLEERERQRQDALNNRYNFIREFARYDMGDYPVYIQIPKLKAIFFSQLDILEPQIRFTEFSDVQDEEFRIFSYQVCGHTFVIPTSILFKDLLLEKFKKSLFHSNDPFGTQLKEIVYAEDLDYTFRYMNDP